MCGIVGYWDKNGADSFTITQMAMQLKHRGPDQAGVLVSENRGFAFGHRRLSVIDLSIAGQQPMTSPCGRFSLVFNGEIYNHMELRRILEIENAQPNWRGHSDSETLLVSLKHWGVVKTLNRLNGMFAFAFWDDTKQTLFLARDRIGEKPLYYGQSKGTFFFGSELKCLLKHHNWVGEINRDVLTLFLRYSYIPSPFCIYKGFYKLPPAHFITVRENGTSITEPECYWNLQDSSETRLYKKSSEVEKEIIDQFDFLLNDSIKLRTAADVPLGAFLSGGIDSSLVSAIMQKQSTTPIKTFTIGFHENKFNEAPHARSIAKYLGTDHSELYITPEETLDTIPLLPIIWDEPFSDSSQIPTYLVSKLTRNHVTVSLSGDGGDELFFGYQRYIQGYQIWNILNLLPKSIRDISSYSLASITKMLSDLFSLQNSSTRLLPTSIDRLLKLTELAKNFNPLYFYQQLVSHWKNPESIVLKSKEISTIFTHPEKFSNLTDIREKMMYIDLLTYLPDDILTKVDRASMAVSLEARVPLLDHRIVEFASNLPLTYKYRNRKGKWLLRQVLNRYLPSSLTDHPKMGFGVPIEQWLRGPLRDWTENLLDEKRLLQEGFFDPSPIRQMWHEHVRGIRRWHYYLWDILMFQAWLEASNQPN